MGEIWLRIGKLRGQTIKTPNGPGFVVEEVTEHVVTIRLVSSGSIFRIKRAMIEQAWLLKSPGERLLPSQVRATGVSERSPAYVAALVNAIS